MSPSQQRDFPLQTLASIPPSRPTYPPQSQQTSIQPTRECHHPSRETFHFKPLPLSPSGPKHPPQSQQTSLQPTRECHHPNRETFHFKPLPLSPQQTYISSPIPTDITPANKRMSPSQQRDFPLQTLASIPPADLHILLNPNRHHSSQQENVTIPTERLSTSNPCLYYPQPTYTSSPIPTDITPANKRMSPSQQRDFPLQTLASIPPADLHILPNPNRHHSSQQENVTIPAERLSTSNPCLHPPSRPTYPPQSQQTSLQPTKECHHPSRETFHFKPLPPSPQPTYTSSPIPTDITPANKRMSPSQQRDFPLQTLASIPPADLHILPNPNRHHSSQQENVTIPAERLSTSNPCLHPPSRPTHPPQSQQTSLQPTRECHHPSRETFHFKPLPPSPQPTYTSSPIPTDITPANKRMSPSQQRDFPLQTLASIPPADLHILPNPNRHHSSQQKNVTIPAEKLSTSNPCLHPPSRPTHPPQSQQTSLQPTRECHHPNRETFHFKPLPLSPQPTYTSSPIPTDITPANKRMSPSQQRDFPLQTLASIPPADLHILPNPNRHHSSQQENVTIPTERLSTSNPCLYPPSRPTHPPQSQQTSLQPTRECHHTSRETFHFKPLPPSPQPTYTSSPIPTDITPANKRMSPSQQRDFPLQTLASIPPADLHILPNPNRHHSSQQENDTIPTERLSTSNPCLYPPSRPTHPPQSQQTSLQPTRECHHPSRETFHFKPLPPSPQPTYTSSPISTDITPANKRMSPSQQRDFPLQTLASIPPADLHILPNPNRHHSSQQENVTIPAERISTSNPCLHPPSRPTHPPQSQQTSLQPTRECHHPSRENFHFKPLPPSPQPTYTSSPIPTDITPANKRMPPSQLRDFPLQTLASIPPADLHILPNPNRHHSSQQDNVTIPTERLSTSNTCLHPPSRPTHPPQSQQTSL